MKKVFVSLLFFLINFNYVSSAINVEKIVHDFQALYPHREDTEMLNKSVKKIEERLQEEFSKLDSVQAKQVLQKKLKELKETNPELFAEIEEISSTPWSDSIRSIAMYISLWCTHLLLHKSLTVLDFGWDAFFQQLIESRCPLLFMLNFALLSSIIFMPLTSIKDVITINDLGFLKRGDGIILVELILAVILKYSKYKNRYLMRNRRFTSCLQLTGVAMSALAPAFIMAYAAYCRYSKHKIANKKSDDFIEVYSQNYLILEDEEPYATV